MRPRVSTLDPPGLLRYYQVAGFVDYRQEPADKTAE